MDDQQTDKTRLHFRENLVRMEQPAKKFQAIVFASERHLLQTAGGDGTLLVKSTMGSFANFEDVQVMQNPNTKGSDLLHKG